MRSCTLLLIFLATLAGCCSSEKPSKPQAEPSPEVDVVPASVAGWHRSDTASATVVLITKLTIPNVFTESAEETALRWRDAGATGDSSLPLYGPKGKIADGRNAKGGYGYSCGINIGPGGDPQSLILQIRYTWTTADQVRGQLHEDIPVAVGEPATISLAGGGKLQVSWQKPSATTKPNSSALPRDANTHRR